ncbi:MAG: hypothetical protein MZU95_04420 [Desulfomicrobium escambiense]|nr:hypothetical protein [Desulfomicrobium escambiense]
MGKNLVQYLPSDSLGIELQLEKSENNLKEVMKEINAVKVLDLDKSEERLLRLQEKNFFDKEIYGYRSQYRELGFIYKIADYVTDAAKNIKDSFKQASVAFTGNSIIKSVKSSIPGLAQKEEMQEVITQFSALNENMQKMLSNKTNPFGEGDIYFKELTTLMSKANKIDSKTNKILEKQKGFSNYSRL